MEEDEINELLKCLPIITIKDISELVDTPHKYYKKHIALPSFHDSNVISFGDDPVAVRQEAIDKGYENPVMYYIGEEWFNTSQN